MTDTPTPVDDELPVMAWMAPAEADDMSPRVASISTKSAMASTSKVNFNVPLVLQSPHVEAMKGLRVENERLRNALRDAASCLGLAGRYEAQDRARLAIITSNQQEQQ